MALAGGAVAAFAFGGVEAFFAGGAFFPVGRAGAAALAVFAARPGLALAVFAALVLPAGRDAFVFLGGAPFGCLAARFLAAGFLAVCFAGCFARPCFGFFGADFVGFLAAVFLAAVRVEAAFLGAAVFWGAAMRTSSWEAGRRRIRRRQGSAG